MPVPAPLRRGIASLLVSGALCALSGCGDKPIRAYRVPKESDDSASTPAASPATPEAARWTAPKGWAALAAGGMRLGSYRVPGAAGESADVSIISFPGSGGDDLANINRWRGQVQLPPIGAEALSAEIQNLETPAGRFVLADMTGKAPSGPGQVRLVGAWLRRPDRVWFFKMMGPAGVVGPAKADFVAFLRSVDLGSPPAGGPVLAGPEAAANTNDLPRTAPDAPKIADAPPPPSNSGSIEGAAGASLRWQAPASWAVKPNGPVRKGSFGIGAAEVAITAFPGDVGGVLANANRWLGQTGLPSVDDTGLAAVATDLEVNGLHGVVIDTGAGAAQRIVAAMISWQGATWFFKLSGPADAVAKARADFLAYLRTVRAP